MAGREEFCDTPRLVSPGTSTKSSLTSCRGWYCRTERALRFSLFFIPVIVLTLKGKLYVSELTYLAPILYCIDCALLPPLEISVALIPGAYCGVIFGCFGMTAVACAAILPHFYQGAAFLVYIGVVALFCTVSLKMGPLTMPGMFLQLAMLYPMSLSITYFLELCYKGIELTLPSSIISAVLHDPRLVEKLISMGLPADYIIQMIEKIVAAKVPVHTVLEIPSGLLRGAKIFLDLTEETLHFKVEKGLWIIRLLWKSSGEFGVIQALLAVSAIAAAFSAAAWLCPPVRSLRTFVRKGMGRSGDTLAQVYSVVDGGKLTPAIVEELREKVRTTRSVASGFGTAGLASLMEPSLLDPGLFTAYFRPFSAVGKELHSVCDSLLEFLDSLDAEHRFSTTAYDVFLRDEYAKGLLRKCRDIVELSSETIALRPRRWIFSTKTKILDNSKKLQELHDSLEDDYTKFLHQMYETWPQSSTLSSVQTAAILTGAAGALYRSPRRLASAVVALADAQFRWSYLNPLLYLVAALGLPLGIMIKGMLIQPIYYLFHPHKFFSSKVWKDREFQFYIKTILGLGACTAPFFFNTKYRTFCYTSNCGADPDDFVGHLLLSLGYEGNKSMGWTVLGFLVTFYFTVEATMQRIVLRFVGTGVGVGLGFAAAKAFPTSVAGMSAWLTIANFLIIWVSVDPEQPLIGFNRTVGYAFQVMTYTMVIVAVEPGSTTFGSNEIAIARFLGILYGMIIAFIVSILVWPNRAESEARVHASLAIGESSSAAIRAAFSSMEPKNYFTSKEERLVWDPSQFDKFVTDRVDEMEKRERRKQKIQRLIKRSRVKELESVYMGSDSSMQEIHTYKIVEAYIDRAAEELTLVNMFCSRGNIYRTLPFFRMRDGTLELPQLLSDLQGRARLLLEVSRGTEQSFLDISNSVGGLSSSSSPMKRGEQLYYPREEDIFTVERICHLLHALTTTVQMVTLQQKSPIMGADLRDHPLAHESMSVLAEEINTLFDTLIPRLDYVSTGESNQEKNITGDITPERLQILLTVYHLVMLLRTLTRLGHRVKEDNFGEHLEQARRRWKAVIKPGGYRKKTRDLSDMMMTPKSSTTTLVPIQLSPSTHSSKDNEGEDSQSS